ncbi:MAG: hypothetical protein VX464_09615 [Pseudomonadota bacterium]|nr:hypothetical protein [Pseudomonadota bacterium]
MALRFLTILAVLAILTPPASAQDFQEMETVCTDGTRDAETRSRACTTLIDGAAFTDLSDYARTHLNRAEARQAVGDLQGALADLDTTLDYDPYSFQAYMVRGDVLLRLEEPYRAIADFSVAAGLNPLSAMPYARRGLALYAHREYASAIQDLETALSYDADHAEARRTLAWILATAPDAGLRDGTRAADLLGDIDRNDPQTILVEAAVLAESGDIAGALARYKEIAGGSEAATTRFQTYLQSSGYFDGSIDGKFDPTLEAALTKCLEQGCRIGAPRAAP